MKYLAVIIFTLVLVLTGCATSEKYKLVQTKEIKVTVTEVDALPALSNGTPQLARTTVGDGFCVIELTQYPKCLLHEIRHCFEGNWHEGRETTKDC